MLSLNGSDGGGQILRSALTLSMITGKAFRMNHIRGKRKKPGLMRQHLACVKAAETISHASVSGAEIGSTELIFTPQAIHAGDYHFTIGSAGSTTLLAQTIMPALWHADAKSNVTIEGGTHNPLAPTQHFLDAVYLAALRRIGINCFCRLLEYGFSPAGGGRIAICIAPSQQVQPLILLERGARKSLEIEVISRNLDLSIAERVVAAMQKNLDGATVLRTNVKEGPGVGICSLIKDEYENTTEISSSIGEVALSAESMAKRAVNGIKNFQNSGATVNRYLADQLILPMALHQGGEFLTLPPDDHLLTNKRTIELFLPEKIISIEKHKQLYRVCVSGVS
jgi:RNA 3'-terminal phosphate cyclase (ATP)